MGQITQSRLIELSEILSKSYDNIPSDISYAVRKGALFGAYHAIAYLLGIVKESDWQKFLEKG